MITNIYIQNFKAFPEAEIPPGQLNILTGLNGMGKSTFLQSLLLLRQSYRQNTLNKGLLLNGEYIAHVAKHQAWFEQKKRESLAKSQDLWERREEFFPHLVLCGEVEKQLTRLGIQSKFFAQIIEKLKRLNKYAQNWQGDSYSDFVAKQQYGLNVSGESEGTLKKYGRQRKFRWVRLF